jgi:hypothetical protein
MTTEPLGRRLGKRVVFYKGNTTPGTLHMIIDPITVTTIVLLELDHSRRHNSSLVYPWMEHC